MPFNCAQALHAPYFFLALTEKEKHAFFVCDHNHWAGLILPPPAKATSTDSSGTIRYEVSLNLDLSQALQDQGANGWSASFEVSDIDSEVKTNHPTAISIDGITVVTDPTLYTHEGPSGIWTMMWEGDDGFNWIASKPLWDAIVVNSVQWRDLARPYVWAGHGRRRLGEYI